MGSALLIYWDQFLKLGRACAVCLRVIHPDTKNDTNTDKIQTKIQIQGGFLTGSAQKVLSIRIYLPAGGTSKKHPVEYR